MEASVHESNPNPIRLLKTQSSPRKRFSLEKFKGGWVWNGISRFACCCLILKGAKNDVYTVQRRRGEALSSMSSTSSFQGELHLYVGQRWYSRFARGERNPSALAQSTTSGYYGMVVRFRTPVLWIGQFGKRVCMCISWRGFLRVLVGAGEDRASTQGGRAVRKRYGKSGLNLYALRGDSNTPVNCKSNTLRVAQKNAHKCMVTFMMGESFSSEETSARPTLAVYVSGVADIYNEVRAQQREVATKLTISAAPTTAATTKSNSHTAGDALNTSPSCKASWPHGTGAMLEARGTGATLEAPD